MGSVLAEVNSVVRHCRMSANGGHGVQVGREGEEEQDSSEGLLFESVVSHDNAPCGFYFESCRVNTFVDNDVHGNGALAHLLVQRTSRL